MTQNERESTVNVEFFPIFCENVRKEDSGQFTYVGVYQSNISVDEFPFTFPQLSMSLSLIGPDTVLPGELTVLAHAGERVLLEFSPNTADLTPKEKDDGLVFMNIHLIGDALTLEEPAKITASVILNGHKLESNNSITVVKKTTA